jgi:hypothetical protein
MILRKFFYLLFFILFGFLFSQKSSTNTILSTFNPPNGYKKLNIVKNGFSDWIRNLPLKPSKSDVLDFRGKIFKSKNDTTVAAVIDWSIRGKRLEQCMDLLVRFYAEYLWENKEHRKLALPLPGKQLLKWSEWEKGFRPKFSGINFDLIKSEKYNPTKSNFNIYLNLIFAESHTQQFYYAYPAIKRQEVQIGDFIVKRGVKGHAVMIVDLAQNENGELIALIGQGDTPACEFYLLNYKKNQPWFPLDFSKEVIPLPIKKKMTWDGLRRFE